MQPQPEAVRQESRKEGKSHSRKMVNLTKAVETIKDVTALAQSAVQQQLEERKELANLSDEQKEDLRIVETLASRGFMSEWRAGQAENPAGQGTNSFFVMSPAPDKLLTIGHGVSPYADNYYLTVKKGEPDKKTVVLALVQSKIAQRLFETLIERAKYEGSPLPGDVHTRLTDV
jgi:hypothetical protein